MKGEGGIVGFTHSGGESATRDLFDVIARALGGGGGEGKSGDGGRVVFFDNLSAVAEAEEDGEHGKENYTNGNGGGSGGGSGGEGGEQTVRGGSGPCSAAGRVAALVHCCRALTGCAVVALAHADAVDGAGGRGGSGGGGSGAGGGWLVAVERTADVTLCCVGLGSGHAEDVHGHIHVSHRTGRMMPPGPGPGAGAGDPAAAASGMRGLTLGEDAAAAAVAGAAGAGRDWQIVPTTLLIPMLNPRSLIEPSVL